MYALACATKYSELGRVHVSFSGMNQSVEVMTAALLGGTCQHDCNQMNAAHLSMNCCSDLLFLLLVARNGQSVMILLQIELLESKEVNTPEVSRYRILEEASAALAHMIALRMSRGLRCQTTQFDLGIRACAKQ